MAQDGFKLIIQDGPAAGREIALDRPEVVLGRDPAADVQIDSPGVSRRHARIARQADGYTIEDLGSSNGTFLNDQPVAKATPLTPGDRIGLGKSVRLAFQGAVPQPTGGSGSTFETRLDVSREAAAAVSGARGGGAPRLAVTIAGGESRAYPLERPAYTIGRGEDNDIVVASMLVSRHHARLEKVEGGYQLSVSPEASNPVYAEGRPLSGPYQLKHEDKLRIGGNQYPGMMVTFEYQQPGLAALQAAALDVDFGEKGVITIGRDPSNDVVLDAPAVSRFHAQVERVGQRYRVRDLRSSNGTFVNDQAVEGEAWLKPQDTIRIGPHQFVLGLDQLARYDHTSGLRVDALGLNKWVRPDLNILQNITLTFKPREFIVVVGQSGGGKSTLVDAIAGYRPATHGQVLVNDVDVYRNFDAIRNEIGFVPQKDIIHMELTIYQALDYAAQLRMPPDTSKEERHKRVMEVLDDLDLVHRKDVQISGLSGGQQKRVSIGVELLTRPGLFFLDEPTSGLDPGTETALMQLMRRLADQGRTIILITHATKNVMLADKVVFLARGGYLVWFGPPEEALRFFDQYRSERERRSGEIEFDHIYAILDDPSKGKPAEWAERFRAHPAYAQYIEAPLAERGRQAAAPAPSQPVEAAKTSRRQISSARQFAILSARNLKILGRDRFSLALMLATPVLVGLLDVLLSFLLGRTPFDFAAGAFDRVTVIMFLLGVYGIMVGGLAQMREIVKEDEIYRRERLVNLRILPYVLSKVWIAVLLAVYQSAAYVTIRYLAFEMPGGPPEFLLILLTMTLATLAGMLLGLFASALAPNANSVPLIVILLILPQLVLGGGLVRLPDFVSALTSSRWAFEAMMAVSGVGADIAGDVCWQLPADVRAVMSADLKNERCACMGLNALRQESCDFPGLGAFYNPLIDQPPPEAPAPLRDAPPEPEIPPPPPEPVDQTDTVAVAQYLELLKVYQEQVNSIQDSYKAAITAYQAEAEVFKAQMVTYQQGLINWQIGRAAATEPAEGVIARFYDQYGWTFVDNADAPAYWAKLLRAWAAQGIIMLVLFGSILVLMKRKDA